MNKILMFAGSNNPNSINHSLIEFATKMMEPESYELIKLAEYALPLYVQNAEKTGLPADLVKLKAAIEQANKIIIGVAEHNGSLSAFFKNVIDWLSRVGTDYRLFAGKQILLLSASPGQGGKNAIRHTSDILVRLGAVVTDTLVIQNFYQKISHTNEGRMLDEPTKAELSSLINKFKQ